MITSVDVCMLKTAADVCPRYVVYFMSSAPHLAWLQAICRGGTRDRVSRSQLGAIRVLVPPLDEQRTIATFLDRETAKIDALIDKKQRLIELLQEKRTALITQAVTQGLDPEAEMKDSGVEWLGEIPGHWDVALLKHLADLQTGLTLGKQYGAGKLVRRPYLRVANVQAGYVNLGELTEIEIPEASAHRHELRPGDVLMTEGGDFDKLGRGTVWEGEIEGCLHQNHIFAVRTQKTLLQPHFLASVLESGYGRTYFTATSKQSTNLASTNSTKVRNFPLPLPPLAEQQEILASLQRSLGNLRVLTSKVEVAVDCLREYRTALISAAVTGKIDVREELQ